MVKEIRLLITTVITNIKTLASDNQTLMLVQQNI